jgi:NADPH-dependent 2,4-dienoyl-CoA reductase/sulfur reductase-like enzyme
MKVVIVGGVAGGASCAARLRRLDEDAEIMLIQSGPDVSFASCGMPYFIGGEITDRTKMSVQTPESLRARFNLDVRVNSRVTKIDIDLKTITAHNELTGEEMTANYDELVLAVGAAPFRPSVPGIDRQGIFTLRNLTDMDNIVAWINKQHAKKDENSLHGTELHCIVGGAGFVGLEMVEQLIKRDMTVTLVEKNPQVLTPLDVEMAGILSDELRDHGVTVITGDAISEFKESSDDPESTIVQLESGKVLPPAQLIILGLGVRPDTKVIQEAGINCTDHGHVVVDDSMRTSAPHVWAVGDSIEVRNPILSGDTRWAVALAGPANRQGRMVADNIRGDTRTYKGTYGAAVIRIFKLVAACVGVNEKILKHHGLPYSVVHVHPGSHAGYFPGAKSINFKLIFNPRDGIIYGV